MMKKITDTFESRQAAKIVGVPERTWRYWATNGLIIPLEDAVGRPGIRRRYSFKNLIQGAILRDLAKQKITLSVGKKALKHLGERNFDDKTACYLLIIDGGNEIQVLSKLTMAEIEKQTAAFSQTITVILVHNVSREIQKKMRIEQD